MKKQVLFIHSAGAQGIHQGSSDLIAYLKDTLHDDYHLIHPIMPNPEDPKYVLWEAQLEKELMMLDDEVIIIGHSLGGSVLLKYLSEKTIPCSISGLFIIAAPYWGKDKDWQASDYILSENFAAKLPTIPKIFLYHSIHDKVVPFTHFKHYKQKLPMANTQILNGNEHDFSNGLPKLVNDIKGL